MSAMLDGARRVAGRLTGRARRRLTGDDGFVLLESIIAISLITVIMAAVGAEYVASVASVTRQRASQNAAQVANSTIDQMRALRPSDLVAGRDSASVTAQFRQGNAITAIKPWLLNMDPSVDSTAASNAGAAATIPTSCDPNPLNPTASTLCTQQPGTTAFRVSQFIGTCWLATLAADCVSQTQLQPAQVPTATQYLRVVVSVSWRSSTCLSGCYYVTGTLINSAADPTFHANQAAPAAPIIINPGNQSNDVGDTVSVQLALQSGTGGVPTIAWDIASGTLPAGLTLATSGLIYGTATGPPGITPPLVVRVTDGYGRQDTTAFSWSIFNPPTVITPPDQTTPINTAVTLQLTTTCPNTPCTYTLNNNPTGLSISNTGLITGTPTVAGASTTSVTIVDASGRTLTSNAFTWSVLPNASSCPTATTVANGGFDTPTVAAGAHNVGNGSTGLVWRTSNANGQIEYWANGGNSTTQNGNTPIAAQDGTQWIETDGAGLDTIYQDLATTPGQVLQWSLWHRARNVTNNVNAVDSIQVQMGSVTQQAAQIPNGSMSPTISDTAVGWVQYTGSYTVPAGQTNTRFEVTATATSSGNAAAGNFLDAVSVTGTPCLSSAVAAQSSTVNTAISGVQLTASQGSGSYTWSGGAALPAGLTLSPSGLITGTPTTVGTTNVRLILTDQLTGFQEFVNFSWTVFAAPSISAPPNQIRTVGTPVSVAVTSTCPNGPCTYTLNNPPAGLAMSGSAIAGTPTAAGTTTSTVTIRDAAGATVTSGPFTWLVVTASTITSPGNQTSTVGTTVSVTPPSTCNYAPCSYTLSGQPAGLTISTSGVISGTLTTAGTSTSVTATITDGAGFTSTTAPFSWTVYARPSVTNPGAQTSTVNFPVILPISSTCPNAPCTYTLTGAPAGLSINSANGRITGTPSTTGTSGTVQVTVTDNANVSVSTSFSWKVTAGPSVTAPANQSTVNNAAVSLALITSCPNSPCAYSLNGGPAGLTVSNAGVITGTVTSPVRTFTGVTVTVTDSSGATATSGTFSWAVTAPLAGRWTFDEASGATAADASGNNRPATLYGSATRTSTAEQGPNALALPALPLLGNPSAATAGPVLNTANSFTVSAWVKISNNVAAQTFVSQDGVNTSAFALQYRIDNGGRFAFTRTASDTISTATYASAVSAPTVGQWYQLTGVYDATANALTLYVNGVRQSTVAYTNGWNATRSFVIGRGLALATGIEFTNGAIDDVRAYSTALSADAVAQIAQDGYWRLDEGAGSTAQDSSLYGGTGTLNSGVGWTPGIAGAAAQFNGTTGAISTTSGALDTGQSFSVVAWAKADSAGSTGTVVSVDGANVSGFTLGASAGKWVLTRAAADSTSAATTTVTATSAFAAGQWYRLAAVYDSVAKTLTLYVNGVQQGSPVSFTSGFSASGTLVIGRGKIGSTTTWFGGAIDDVQTFQTALDQAGVTARTPLVPPTPATPTAVTGAASATASWTAPANVAGNPITGYVVTPYLAGVAQTSVTFSSTATTQTVSGLTTGGSYTFSVAAVNANGTSPTSGMSGSVLVS